MRRLFQKLEDRLRAFVGQRETLLLLVRCRDEECGYVLKTIEALDESTQDIFWMFAEGFGEPQSYVESLVRSLRARLEILTRTIEENGGEAWPALPPRLLDPATAPVARMHILIQYLRKRIPDLDAQGLVCALTPLKIADPRRWRLFLRDLTVYDPAAPWCHHVRLIAREPPEPVLLPEATPALRAEADPTSFPSTEIHPVDLSVEAMQNAAKEDVADRALPIADRCQALLIDAMVDYAHQRYPQALQKYQLLRAFYAALELKDMLALVLNGIGEVFARVGSRDAAVEHFEMALTPALESKSHPVLLNISLNLGNLYLAEKNWNQAAEYYVGAEALATACLNAHVKLACLENIGVCGRELRDHGGAQKAWQDGAKLARSLREEQAQKRILMRLRSLYTEARMRDQVEAIDAELRSLP